MSASVLKCIFFRCILKPFLIALAQSPSDDQNLELFLWLSNDNRLKLSFLPGLQLAETKQPRKERIEKFSSLIFYTFPIKFVRFQCRLRILFFFSYFVYLSNDVLYLDVQLFNLNRSHDYTVFSSTFSTKSVFTLSDF